MTLSQYVDKTCLLFVLLFLLSHSESLCVRDACKLLRFIPQTLHI